MSYRVHLLALPNAPTTKAYSLDGFCQCTIRFAKLLKSLGHTVYLYGAEENEAPCDEFIPCITKEEREIMLGTSEYQHAAIEEKWGPWQLGNARMIREVAIRKQARDFLCLIGGASQKQVADAHPDLMCVEYSIGYPGSFSQYRVFESHAWMHSTYGFQQGQNPEGSFWHTVIPAFFDPTEFEFCEQPEDYFLYVGRFIKRKGVEIACRAAKAAGVNLKSVGHASEFIPNYGENLGPKPMDVRNRLMSRAKAVIMPTTYVEPFGCVAVEAQMCGTPVITTDYGGFTETVEQGKTGFRCNYLGQFVQAIKNIGTIDRSYVRERAVSKYSIDAVRQDYQKYFDRLNLLWNGGWNSLH